jgi:hypothetical protein
MHRYTSNKRLHTCIKFNVHPMLLRIITYLSLALRRSFQAFKHCPSYYSCISLSKNYYAIGKYEENRRVFFYVLPIVHLEYNRVQKNQPYSQLILSIFRHPLHVSGVSRPIISIYNCLYTTVGTIYSF